MAKIPQFGDPEILPKGTITRPSRRRMPYGPSGALLPEGPEFDVEIAAPDLDAFPQWQRFKFDAWTTPEQRDLVRTFLINFFRTNSWPVEWAIEERNSLPRQSVLRPPNPFFIMRMTRKADRRVFEVAINFLKGDREDDDRFNARLTTAGQALQALHVANPVS